MCTLEPCSHIGKTGSCAEFIVQAGFKNIIIGAVDPNPKVSGRGIEILRNNKINVEVGVCEDLVEKQNKFFFYNHKNNKPYIHFTSKLLSPIGWPYAYIYRHIDFYNPSQLCILSKRIYL